MALNAALRPRVGLAVLHHKLPVLVELVAAPLHLPCPPELLVPSHPPPLHLMDHQPRRQTRKRHYLSLIHI